MKDIRVKSIVAGIDFSDLTDAVLQTSVSLALSSGLSIELVHAANPEADYSLKYQAETQDILGSIAAQNINHEIIAVEIKAEYLREKRKIEEIEEKIKTKGINCSSRIISGPPGAGLLSVCQIIDADFLVIGSHSKGFVQRAVMGSVADFILHNSPIPVIITPAKKGTDT